jgi:hypothetical protein
MFLVDTQAGRVLHDEEIKRDLAARKPYRAWVAANRVGLDELPEPLGSCTPSTTISCVVRQRSATRRRS